VWRKRCSQFQKAARRRSQWWAPEKMAVNSPDYNSDGVLGHDAFAFYAFRSSNPCDSGLRKRWAVPSVETVFRQAVEVETKAKSLAGGKMNK